MNDRELNDLQEQDHRPEAVWIDTAEQAKLVRAALRRAFPGVRFRVRIHRYSGGSSVDVRWTDGPTWRAVKAVTDPYDGQRFDGMVDLGYSVRSWLSPDGSARLAHDPGSGGSRGSNPERFGDPRPGDRLVHFSGMVSTQRELSPQARGRVLAWAERRMSPMDAEAFAWRIFQRATFTPDGLMHVEREG